MKNKLKLLIITFSLLTLGASFAPKSAQAGIADFATCYAVTYQDKVEMWGEGFKLAAAEYAAGACAGALAY